eukprot:m.102750 g.102750  ORF g.102750 m.102750 type:complete len:306 (-) comp9025_c0_seq1:142-1059(-)
MRLEVYRSICARIDAGSDGGVGQLLHETALQHPGVPFDTLRGIYANRVKTKIKMTARTHKTNASAYYGAFVQLVAAARPNSSGSTAAEEDDAADSCNGILLDLAQRVDMQPSALARSILRSVAERLKKRDVSGCVKEWMASADTGSLALGLGPGETIDGLTGELLAREVHACNLKDDSCGPLAERVRHSIGLEYEFILYEMLANRGFRFTPENVLRSANCTSTPDIVFDVKVELNGHQVYWIDSKASFGDESMSDSFKDQFFRYHRTHGPGIVIYWFGFVEEFAVWQDEGIFILDHFPEELRIVT